jgi:hypothetical protein
MPSLEVDDLSGRNLSSLILEFLFNITVELPYAEVVL